ncbi:MAG: outer membrane lipoprotein-sorting protein [Cyclobacteriaceae bacterium]
MSIIRFFGMLMITSFAVSSALAQTAEEIIRNADQLMKGNSSKGEMRMEIIRPKWTREISMKTWSIGNDYSLTLITSPARDAGTGFLKREKELWNWQPTIDRVIKMPPSMMMQSWMGSDFTNDDLVRESSIVKDYQHKLLGDTTIEGYAAWKLELIPNEDAPVVWGRILAYIEKDNYFQLLFKYYDEDGFLINTMILSDIKQLGNRTIPTRLEMIPAENPDQKTVLIYLDMEFDLALEEQFFSLQSLKRLR